MLTVRARALATDGSPPRSTTSAPLLESVLQHRMAMSFGARADGVTVRDVIGDLVGRIG